MASSTKDKIASLMPQRSWIWGSRVVSEINTNPWEKNAALVANLARVKALVFFSKSTRAFSHSFAIVVRCWLRWLVADFA